MATTPLPKFPAGGSVTVHASAALTGGRMVAQSTTVPNGGNAVVAVPAAGARVCGVMGEDVASGSKGLMHKPGQEVWIEAGETLAPGDLVMSSNTGVAMVRTSTNVVCGEVKQGAASGALALVDFRPALT